MSELVVIVTDFYAAARSVPPGARGTAARDTALPSLARMARYGRVEPVPDGWRAWTAAWLGRADLAVAAPAAVAAASPRAVAAVVSARDGDHVPDGSCASADAHTDAPRAADFVWFADPVHLIAGMTSLHLAPRGVLALDAEAQAELGAAFDGFFAELGWRLAPTRAGRFLAVGPALPRTVRTTEPARALGSSVAEALPRGVGAGTFLALGAEIEMWLHEHPLNVRRVRAGLPPISTLWLWGGGARLDAGARDGRAIPSNEAVSHGVASCDTASVRADSRQAASLDHSPQAAVFSDDAYMAGLAHLAGARIASEPAGIAQVAAERAPRRIVTLELFGTRMPAGAPAQGMVEAPDAPLHALEIVDREWIAPALELIARREITQLTLIANDRRVSITAGDLLKVWRRRRTALEALQ